MITALITLIVVGLMISINALYVAGEFSSVSARKTRIAQLAEEGNSLAKTLLPILQTPKKLDNYIAASQVGITLSSIVLGIYGERQIAPLIEPWLARLPIGSEAAGGAIATTLVLILLTTLQVVLGELLPKSVGIQYPERLALLTVLPVKWSADYLLRPLIAILNGSGALVLKLLGLAAHAEHAHVHSPEEIVILVRESHRGGLIDLDERQFLQNVFRSTRVQAGEIAIPRNRMVAAPIDRPLAQVLEMAAESAFTRIPIYEQDIDHISGFVHLRDLFALHRSDPTAGLRSILRPVPFVPESLSLPAVWDRLDQAQSYLAIVFDEYGGTAGLLTREDLIEELFGELQDEFDNERAMITPAGEGRVVVRGDMLISNLNDLLEIDLPTETSSTVGGLIMEQLGQVPRVSDTIEIEGITLQVEATAHNAATSVRITLPDPDTSLSKEVL
jgi:CBS domain containing-hemolysin-like protein